MRVDRLATGKQLDSKAFLLGGFGKKHAPRRPMAPSPKH